MNKYIIILLVFVNCGNKNERKSPLLIDNKKPVQIDNYRNIINFSVHKEVFKTNFKGYILGFSRYVSYTDEKNKNIVSLYEKYKLKDFNSIISFTNLKRDTVYTFPISEEYPTKSFDENFYKNKILTFYSTCFFDKKYGQVIIIDSIK